jgi:hypothetical protein
MNSRVNWGRKRGKKVTKRRQCEEEQGVKQVVNLNGRICERQGRRRGKLKEEEANSGTEGVLCW